MAFLDSNITSAPLILNTGIPQGCVLSPLNKTNVFVAFKDDNSYLTMIQLTREKSGHSFFLTQNTSKTKRSWCTRPAVPNRWFSYS